MGQCSALAIKNSRGSPILMVLIATFIIRHNRQRSRTADATLMAGLTNRLSR